MSLEWLKKFEWLIDFKSHFACKLQDDYYPWLWVKKVVEKSGLTALL